MLQLNIPDDALPAILQDLTRLTRSSDEAAGATAFGNLPVSAAFSMLQEELYRLQGLCNSADSGLAASTASVPYESRSSTEQRPDSFHGVEASIVSSSAFDIQAVTEPLSSLPSASSVSLRSPSLPASPYNPPSLLPPSLIALIRPADPPLSESRVLTVETSSAVTCNLPPTNQSSRLPPTLANLTVKSLKIKIPLLQPLSQKIWNGEFGEIIDYDLSSDSDSSKEASEGSEPYEESSDDRRSFAGLHSGSIDMQSGLETEEEDNDDDDEVSIPLKRSCKASGPKPKRRCVRNGNSGPIGRDQDIGYMSFSLVPEEEDDEGESEVDAPEPLKGPSRKSIPQGWRTDGAGPPVTANAGFMLHQLTTIFTPDRQAILLELINYLKNPDAPGFGQKLTHGTEIGDVISDIRILEKNARANDLLYMCTLVQLALCVDTIRIQAAHEHKRRPGMPSVAAKHNVATNTFANWHMWGARLLHLCCAGTMYMLPIIACTNLRTTMTYGPKQTTGKNINSLANALRAVEEGKWRPLVKQFITVIHFLQKTNIPVLQNYEFVRGKDRFRFGDMKCSDEVLGSVENNLFELPPQAAEWASPQGNYWSPSPGPVPPPPIPEIITIQTALVLERSTELPYAKQDAKTWTESQRKFAEDALEPDTVEDLRDNLVETHASGTSQPGVYVEIDANILAGKTLVLRDSNGQDTLNLLTLPVDMAERLTSAFKAFNAIFPGELRPENSRDEGYSYGVFTFTNLYRMAEQGHGAPKDVHPNYIHKPDVKVNFHQRIPYSTAESLKKSMQYAALVDVLAEVLEFQCVNFEHLQPEKYEEIRIFADLLPLNATSPAYPFAGFMLNLRVVTDAHKDTKDKELCVIIFMNEDETCTGGHLCLYELGVKLKVRTGNIIIFPSCYVTHFNTHFEGLRASIVLHTDKEGDKWAEPHCGGWDTLVARHPYIRA